jgi:hypothetical protein
VPYTAAGDPSVYGYKVADTGGFLVRNLSLLSYARGFTSWHYRAATETLEQLLSEGYFDRAVDLLQVGDQVIISCPSGGTVAFVTSKLPHIVLSPVLPFPP